MISDHLPDLSLQPRLTGFRGVQNNASVTPSHNRKPVYAKVIRFHISDTMNLLLIVVNEK